MFGKIKLRIAVIALCAILLTSFMSSTLAYYTVTGKATNVITMGSIQFIIHEMTDQGVPFPTEGVKVQPGDVVSKQVTIESDCSHPFYLRVKVISALDDQVISEDECFKLNIDPENWELHDGWYYYKEIVDPYQTTEQVFSHVEIVGSEVDNSYLGKTLSLTVLAQAVQSENNALVDGAIYTAKGWPQE